MKYEKPEIVDLSKEGIYGIGHVNCYPNGSSAEICSLGSAGDISGCQSGQNPAW